jgi:hypothetical protein
VTVSGDDQRRMDSLRRSLASIESDVEAPPGQLAEAIASANRFRLEHGIAPLASSDERPEEEFYRRARALGFRRFGR